MLRLFWFLVTGRWGCDHVWTTDSKCVLRDRFGTVGTRYVLRCEKCGDVKKKDFL